MERFKLLMLRLLQDLLSIFMVEIIFLELPLILMSMLLVEQSLGIFMVEETKLKRLLLMLRYQILQFMIFMVVEKVREQTLPMLL